MGKIEITEFCDPIYVMDWYSITDDRRVQFAKVHVFRPYPYLVKSLKDQMEWIPCFICTWDNMKMHLHEKYLLPDYETTIF